MAYDPQVQQLRAQREAAGAAPLYTLTVEQARAEDLRAIQVEGGTPEPVAQVRDLHIPGPGGELPIRVYTPAGTGPFPVLVYFFGGGWVLGTLDTSDAICRSLTNAVSCVTVAVGYRLAPEHRFPAAAHDAYAATRWVAGHAGQLGGDPDRIAVAGDSAGGNLAAGVALQAREGGPRLAAQVLVYPNTDYLDDSPSMHEHTDPCFFNRRSVGWYWAHYLPSAADGEHPLASPLRAPELTGLPPTLLITAEHDPLRDQGERYAERLRQAGVPVELTRYAGMVHGFFSMAGTLDGARRAVAEVAGYLRDALHAAYRP